MSSDPLRTDRDRTRAAYDQVAESYATVLAGSLDASPWERDALSRFADRVHGDGGGSVADVGCGTGRTLTHLTDHGLDVIGIDLSPAMLGVARRDHATLGLAVGDLAALPIAGCVVAGVAAWYSVIHLSPEDRRAAFAELRRVLRPGGHLLVGFQVGDEVVHLTAAYGHEGLDYLAYRLDPGRVEAELVAAGFEVVERSVRPAQGSEPTPQGWLLARGSVA